MSPKLYVPVPENVTVVAIDGALIDMNATQMKFRTGSRKRLNIFTPHAIVLIFRQQ